MRYINRLFTYLLTFTYFFFTYSSPAPLSLCNKLRCLLSVRQDLVQTVLLLGDPLQSTSSRSCPLQTRLHPSALNLSSSSDLHHGSPLLSLMPVHCLQQRDGRHPMCIRPTQCVFSTSFQTVSVPVMYSKSFFFYLQVIQCNAELQKIAKVGRGGSGLKLQVA